MSVLGDLSKGPVDNAEEVIDHFFVKLLEYTKSVAAMLPSGKTLVIRVSLEDEKGG